jgi:hypothetical protein
LISEDRAVLDKIAGAAPRRPTHRGPEVARIVEADGGVPPAGPKAKEFET